MFLRIMNPQSDKPYCKREQATSASIEIAAQSRGYRQFPASIRQYALYRAGGTAAGGGRISPGDNSAKTAAGECPD